MAELSLAFTYSGQKGVEPDREQEIGGHSIPHGRPPDCSGASSRPAPVGTRARRRRSPAPHTYLRVQRHQLHERPGLLELSERHRAAAEPPALLRRPRPRHLPGPGVPGFAPPRPPPSPRDPPALAGPSAAAAAAAALALRLSPSPGAAAPIGYLREGRGRRSPAPAPAARHSRRGPPPPPRGERWPRLHLEPLARALLRPEEALLTPPSQSLSPVSTPPKAGPGPLPHSARLKSVSRYSFSLQRKGIPLPFPHTYRKSGA